MLWSLCVFLGPMCDQLGTTLLHLDPSWAILGRSWGPLRLSWDILGHLWGILESSRAYHEDNASDTQPNAWLFIPRAAAPAAAAAAAAAAAVAGVLRNSRCRRCSSSSSQVHRLGNLDTLEQMVFHSVRGPWLRGAGCRSFHRSGILEIVGSKFLFFLILYGVKAALGCAGLVG